MTYAGRAAVLLVAAAMLAPAAPRADAASSAAKKLLDAWIKAKKDDERAAAWKAIEAAPAMELADLPALRDDLMQHFAKRAHKVAASGRDEWFDEKKEGWKGLYMVSGKGT